MGEHVLAVEVAVAAAVGFYGKPPAAVRLQCAVVFEQHSGRLVLLLRPVVSDGEVQHGKFTKWCAVGVLATVLQKAGDRVSMGR